MDYFSVSEVMEFNSSDGPFASNVNAYLRHGWVMLTCCTQTDVDGENQCVYVLLGWPHSDPAPHLGTDFHLTDD